MLAILALSFLGYAGVPSRVATPSRPPVSLDAATTLPTTRPDTVPLFPGVPSTPEKKGPSEFQLNLGRVIDTLRVDHPRFFSHRPDFSIFSDNVVLCDPSGEQRLSGKDAYARMFDALRFIRRGAMQDATLTHRLVVSDRTIRVRWHAKLWMRDPATGFNTLANGEAAVVQLDGISVYELDDDALVRVHRLENIVVNGKEQTAVTNLNLPFTWPAGVGVAPEVAMPGFYSPTFDLSSAFDHSLALPAPERRGAAAAATAAPAGGRARGGRRAPAPLAMAQPGTPKETPMQRAARERAEDAEKAARVAAANRAAAEQRERGERRGLFGISAPQQCETSYDCDAPMVCCDLIFASVCCHSGLLVPPSGNSRMRPQEALIPIPVEADDQDRPQQPPSDGPYGPGPYGPRF